MVLDYNIEYKNRLLSYVGQEDISELVHYKLGPFLNHYEVRYLARLPKGVFFEELFDFLDLYADEYLCVQNYVRDMVSFALDEKFSHIAYTKWRSYLWGKVKL